MPRLYFLRRLLTKKNKQILYDSWIKSYILYGIEIYGWVKKTEMTRLQKIQNKIVKILFSNKYTFHAKDLYDTLGILQIKQLQKYTIIIKYFREMKIKRQEKIKEKPYETKNTTILPIVTRNKFGERKSEFYIPNIFSEFPIQIWKLDKMGEIKKELRAWLLKGS